MDIRVSFFILFLSMVSVLLNDHFQKTTRSPASVDKSCQRDGTNCPFLIIGHRGAPYIVEENTLGSFDESLNRGANAVEADMIMTRDGYVVVMHDRHLNDLIALARQVGLEGLPNIPYAQILEMRREERSRL